MLVRGEPGFGDLGPENPEPRALQELASGTSAPAAGPGPGMGGRQAALFVIVVALGAQTHVPCCEGSQGTDSGHQEAGAGL